LATDPPASVHVLSRKTFESVAGGTGDAGDVAQLTDTERSWRVTGLLYVIEELSAVRLSSPLASIEDARTLLVRAAEADEPAAAEVSLYPTAGIWISHILRRLRGVVKDDSPLWLDVGYLHDLAAAAAIRADIDFSITVPVRDGAVVLPSLGMAVFPDPRGEAAEVRRTAGKTTITVGEFKVRLAGDDLGWRPLPRCESEVDGARIALTLDDVDPYRDLCGYSAPAPLDAEALHRWREAIDNAWRILAGQDRRRAERVAAAVRLLIPLPSAEQYRPLSASCDEAYAAVMASMPDEAAQLAVTLVHETQHVMLGAMMHLFEFVDNPGGALLYAPWRDDPRPLSGMLQGTYAFVGVADYLRERHEPIAQFEFALWRHQLGRVLSQLCGDPRLSEYGQELVTALADTVATWADTPVPQKILELATTIAADHHGQWRALHVVPPAEWVERAARAWAEGASCPSFAGPDGEPVTDTKARWLDGRAVLARIWLEDPTGFATLAREPADVTRCVPGTSPADVALIAGDAAGALDAYQQRLREDPDDYRAWVGLGLALAALDRPNRTLLQRPELVRALAGHVVAADPLQLAGWCASVNGSC
jgi:HEXXH motif-containing protein